MSTEVRYTRRFLKTINRVDPKVKEAFIRRRRLFAREPHHSLLHNHALTGKYKGWRSINITGDWRAVFVEHKRGNTRIIVFELIGTHSQLYK